ncbi:hypothetical protein F4776DRAFT_560974 [Hypoxylon sp. NC0597]|nr:hypothetical protein F4776DRAFT_560974 [Hypoxylon sp. NC0597]
MPKSTLPGKGRPPLRNNEVRTVLVIKRNSETSEHEISVRNHVHAQIHKEAEPSTSSQSKSTPQASSKSKSTKTNAEKSSTNTPGSAGRPKGITGIRHLDNPETMPREREDYVLFTDGKSGPWRLLSQFAKDHPFKAPYTGPQAVMNQRRDDFRGKTYEFETAEHYMHEMKARFFAATTGAAGRKNVEIIKKMRETKKPGEAWRLGRSVKKLNKALWDRESKFVVLQGNINKFMKDHHMICYLLSTGTKFIVEARVDTIWGNGRNIRQTVQDIEEFNFEHWGQNKLGYILMHVREFINARAKDTLKNNPQLNVSEAEMAKQQKANVSDAKSGDSDGSNSDDDNDDDMSDEDKPMPDDSDDDMPDEDKPMPDDSDDDMPDEDKPMPDNNGENGCDKGE